VALHLRRVTVTALGALVFALCGLLLSAQAHAAPAGAANVEPVAHADAHGHARRAAHAQCARRSSYRASGGHVRRAAHRRTRPKSSKAHRTCQQRAHTRRGARHANARHRGTGHANARRTSAGHAKARHTTTRPSAPSHAIASHTELGVTTTGTSAEYVLASPDGTCPGAQEAPTEDNLNLIRASTLCLVNRERSAHGESVLTLNTHLEQTAQSHTDEMSSDDYFAHDGPNGDTPASRMRAAGYIYSSQVGYEVGENIAWGTLWLATPSAIVAAWMASPGHRANILDAHYHDTGMGVSAQPPSSLANGQAGAIYTQDFGVIVTG
jgi:uncharacterized protein YkwD